MDNDINYMKRALELSKKGEGLVSPNPLVGAVIVKKNRIIGEGYHKRYGGLHGEIEAFNNCKEDMEGSTMYVTLEPCSHYGKTPPCVDEIIKQKISRVCIGMKDPNPLVAGKGIKKLKEANIEVEVDILKEECEKNNEAFIKYILYKKPFITMKLGMSLDGKIATKTRESMWITGEESRKDVHRLRNKNKGIMVGIGTVLEDDPSLTCRIEYGINPTRIILDSNLRIPLNSKVLKDQDKAKTIVVTTIEGSKKEDEIKKLGGIVLKIKEKNNRIDLDELMLKLGEMNIDSILLEGGGTLNYSALESRIVDKVLIYIAPKLIGGRNSKTAVEGNGIDRLKDAFNLKIETYGMIGEDLFIESYVRK